MSITTLNVERGTRNQLVIIIIPACYTLLALVDIEGKKL
jgi:hypothetical protein